MLFATWYKVTAQLLSLIEFEFAFILALFDRLKPLTDPEGEQTGVSFHPKIICGRNQRFSDLGRKMTLA